MWREVVTDVGDEEDSDTNVGHEVEDSDIGSIVELAPLLKRMLLLSFALFCKCT